MNKFYLFSKYIFHCEFETLVSVMKDKTQMFNPKFYKKLNIHDDNLNYFSNTFKSNYEKGNLFNLLVNSNIITYQIIDMIQTDYFFSIKWKLYITHLKEQKHLIPVQCNFSLFSNNENNFYNNNDNNNDNNNFDDKNFSNNFYKNGCLFVAEYSFEKNFNYIFNKEEIYRQYYYNVFENFVIKNEYMKYFQNHFIIKGDYKKACKLFENFKLICGFFTNVFEFKNSKFLEEGNEIILKINKNKILNYNFFNINNNSSNKNNNYFLVIVKCEKIIKKHLKNFYFLNLILENEKFNFVCEINQNLDFHFMINFKIIYLEGNNKIYLYLCKKIVEKILYNFYQIFLKYSN